MMPYQNRKIKGKLNWNAAPIVYNFWFKNHLIKKNKLDAAILIILAYLKKSSVCQQQKSTCETSAVQRNSFHLRNDNIQGDNWQPRL